MNIKLLRVAFEVRATIEEIPAFRGAMIAKVGANKENLLFHNHLDDDEFHYEYPLIQYKSLHNKFAVLCLGDGVEEIHKFFAQPDWTFQIGRRKDIAVKISSLDISQPTLGTKKGKLRYRISHYLALGSENYSVFKKLFRLADRAAFLEKCLYTHIHIFLKKMNFQPEKPLEVGLLEIHGTHLIHYKGVDLLAFDLEFEANVFLPNEIGLGRNVALGYGLVYHFRP
jgi:Cas6b C-terminal domain/Cas6b N-terminal domain